MIVNLTPHDVDIYNPQDCYLKEGQLYLREEEDTGEYPQSFITYPAAKEPSRVTFVQRTPGMVDGIFIHRWVPREIAGLPEPKKDTYYIVSQMLAQVCPEREDLIFPGTAVRDADGHVIGCVDFSRV